MAQESYEISDKADSAIWPKLNRLFSFYLIKWYALRREQFVTNPSFDRVLVTHPPEIESVNGQF